MVKGRDMQFLEAAPWSAVRRSGKAVIEGFVDQTKQWERVADIEASPHVDRRAAADFIVRAVMDYAINRALIMHMAEALEDCLECDGLTWSAEHDAEIMVRRAREVVPAWRPIAASRKE
jgi:hypothetical protein